MTRSARRGGIACLASNGAVPVVAVACLAVLLLALAAPPRAVAAPPPPPIGAHQAELSAARADVAAAAERLVTLSRRRATSAAAPAADAFVTALKRAAAVVATYRAERVRDGIYAELSALNGIGHGAVEGTAALAKLAGTDAKRPSRRARRQARGVGDELIATARQALVERYRLHGLGTLLRRPSFQAALDEAVERVDTKLRGAINRKLRRVTGLPVVFGVPLKTQIRWAGGDAVADWVGRLAVKAGPAGIVLSVISGGRLDPGRLVALVGRRLRRALDDAFRGKGRLDARTARSLRSLQRRIDQIRNLPEDAAFEALRRQLARGQAAIGATRFLHGDLARRGRDDLAAQLDARIVELQALLDGYGDAVEAVRFHVGYKRLARLLAQAVEQSTDYRAKLGGTGGRWTWSGQLATTTGGRCATKPATAVRLSADASGDYTFAVTAFAGWAFETYVASGGIQIFSITSVGGGDYIVSGSDVSRDGTIQRNASGRAIAFTASGRLGETDAAQIAAAGRAGAALDGRAGLNPLDADGFEIEPDLSPCSATGKLAFAGGPAAPR